LFGRNAQVKCTIDKCFLILGEKGADTAKNWVPGMRIDLTATREPERRETQNFFNQGEIASDGLMTPVWTPDRGVRE